MVSARGPEVGDVQRALHRRGPLGAGHPVQLREHVEDLAGGQLDVEVVELGHDAHRHPRLLGLARQGVAEDLDRALVGQRLGGEHPHRRRLAGAVGPEQPEADSRRDHQVQAVHGGDLAEALDHAAQLDRRPLLVHDV